MKFEKPRLPQFKLNADERKVLEELTEYLEDLDENAERGMDLEEAIDIDDADHTVLRNLILAIRRYDY